MMFFVDIDVNRIPFPAWNIATLVLLAVGILLAIKYKLKKFGFFILLSGALMSLVWELTLYAAGMREYDNELAQLITPIPEIIYHAFSETGAPLLVGTILIDRAGFINLDKYRDNTSGGKTNESEEQIQISGEEPEKPTGGP